MRLISKWITLMCAFRLLGVPNATPLQKPQAWSLRFPCTVSMCAFRVLFVPKAAPGQ